MKLALVFTNDWELYGDGSGDYFEVQHQPLSELINLLETYDAKLSIMAEVFQQIHHKKNIEINPKFKEITEKWDEIIIDSYQRGHDVQLHIHPQWNESKLENNEWILGENWSIGKRDKNQIQEFIKTGKDYLESLLNEIDQNYRCQIFRAGAYYIEPSANVLDVLSRNNFICDTSVTKGTYVDGYYDYRDAYSNIIPWGISTKGVIHKVENSNLIELPIHSAINVDSEIIKKISPKFYYKFRFGVNIKDIELDWMRERDQIKNIRYPISRRAYKKHENRNILWYFSKILSKNSVQLDYDYVPSTVFVKMLKNILESKELKKIANKDLVIPIVASGHVKDMHNTENVFRILELIKREMPESIEYWTISDAANYSINKLVKGENLK